MAHDLKAIAGFETLTGLVKTHFDQSANRYLQNNVFTKKKAILGDVAKWHQIDASRELAPFTGRKGAAIEVANLGVAERTASPATIILSKKIDGHELFREGWPDGRMGPGMQLLPNANVRIQDEAIDLTNQIGATREWACARTLEGSLAVTATSPPGSKTAFTLAWPGVQTLAAGGAYFSDNTKKLITDTTAAKPSLYNFKKKMTDNAGLALGRILINAAIMAQVRNVTEVQNLVRGSIPNAPVLPTKDMINAAISGESAQFVEYDGNYTVGGTVTRFILDANAIGLPASNEYFEMHEGYGVIPLGAGVIGTEGFGDVVSLMKLSQPGVWSYAVLNPRPPIHVEVFVGCTFLPVLAYEKAVILATVNS